MSDKIKRTIDQITEEKLNKYGSRCFEFMWHYIFKPIEYFRSTACASEKTAEITIALCN